LLYTRNVGGQWMTFKSVVIGLVRNSTGKFLPLEGGGEEVGEKSKRQAQDAAESQIKEKEGRRKKKKACKTKFCLRQTVSWKIGGKIKELETGR